MLLGLHLTFKGNNFFTNENLSVTLEFEDSSVKEIIGTKIDWETGRNVTEKEVKTSVGGTATGEIKTTTKTMPQASFFNIFEDRRNYYIDPSGEE